MEGFAFAKFMFTRYREKNRVLPIVTFIVANLRLVLFAWGMLELPMILTEDASAHVQEAISLAVGALFTAGYYLRIERSFQFVYGLLYAFCTACFCSSGSCPGPSSPFATSAGELARTHPRTERTIPIRKAGGGALLLCTFRPPTQDREDNNT